MPEDDIWLGTALDKVLFHQTRAVTYFSHFSTKKMCCRTYNNSRGETILIRTNSIHFPAEIKIIYNIVIHGVPGVIVDNTLT